jgi:hypothetical protein
VTFTNLTEKQLVSELTTTASEFTHGFQCGSCFSIFSFMCMFCRSLFVLLSFFFWPLCCLFFFYLRILIPHLESSNSSMKSVYITTNVMSSISIRGNVCHYSEMFHSFLFLLLFHPPTLLWKMTLCIHNPLTHSDLPIVCTRCEFDSSYSILKEATFLLHLTQVC